MKAALLTLCLVLLGFGIAKANPSYVQTCSVHPTGTSTTQTVTCGTSPTAGDVFYASVYVHHVGTTVTAPANWTAVTTCSDSASTNEIHLYTHVITSTDASGNSFAFSWGSAAYYSHIDLVEVSSANSTSPLDGYSCVHVASGTAPQTVSSSAVTAKAGDLPILLSAQSNTTVAPTAGTESPGGAACTLQVPGNTGGVYEAVESCPNATAASTSASLVYGTASSGGYMVGFFLAAPTPQSLFNAFLLMGIGGPHHAVTVTLPSEATVANYAPSYMYEGTLTSGGGGNDCGTSTYCTGNTTSASTAGSVLQSLNVRYVEDADGVSNFGTFLDPSLPCGADVYCMPMWYMSANLQHCDNTVQSAIYSDLNALAGDVGYLHTTGNTAPFTAAERIYTSGSCANPASSTLYENPANRTASAYWLTEWFRSASYINSRSYYATFFDNVNPSQGATAEYPGNDAADLQNYIADSAAMYASFAPYPVIPNAGGPGGSNWRDNSYDNSHIGTTCTNYVCNGADQLCAGNTAGNIKADVFERPLTSSAYDGATNMGNNLPFLIDTVSHIWSDPGCANVDVVDLEQPFNSSGDSRPLRDLEKAVTMLLQPGDYDGSAGHRAFVQWEYEDCPGGGASCKNQAPIYPEYGLNFVPKTSFAAFSWGGSGDGNGTGPSDTGGATALLIATNGKDVNGATGAIYGRPGTCYKFGVNIGPCFVIVNQSTSAWTIQNSACQIAGNPACNAYGHIWQYTGSGPENLVSDTGSQVCPLGNGCNGGYGESTSVPTIIQPCQYSPTVLTSDCTLILLSQ